MTVELNSNKMGRCKTILTTIVVIVCLFGFVPIKIDPPKSLKDDNNSSLLFSSYVQTFNKPYRFNDSLRGQKLNAFEDAVKEIQELNRNRKHDSSAKFGFTKFSDLTKDEFTKKYLRTELYDRIKNRTKYIKNYKPNKHVLLSSNGKQKLGLELPKKVDWREKNVITKIKNQKDCGACWAFSTVQTLESMDAMKTGKLQEFSVQEIIDCAGYSNNGCDGGDICNLLYWLDDYNVTIQKNEEYPLTLKAGQCRSKKNVTGIQISNFTCADYKGMEDLILFQIAFHGPVTAAVNALLWQNYLNGVIHYHCNSEYLNHAVQIVGYDLTAEIPHYIVRNSWGPDFGDKGYLYIAIGSNMCGIAYEVASMDIK